MYFSARALVLESVPFGEHDFLIDVLARGFGLLTLKMCGGRRPGSRLKILKEPGFYVDLLAYGKPQAQVARLITGRPLQDFSALRSHWFIWASALEVLGFTKRFLTPFDSRADEKLSLVLEILGKMGSLPLEAEALNLMYKLKILDLSGWRLSASDLAREHFDDALHRLCRGLETAVIGDAGSPGDALDQRPLSETAAPGAPLPVGQGPLERQRRVGPGALIRPLPEAAAPGAAPGERGTSGAPARRAGTLGAPEARWAGGADPALSRPRLQKLQRIVDRHADRIIYRN